MNDYLSLNIHISQYNKFFYNRKTLDIKYGEFQIDFLSQFEVGITKNN